MGHGQPHGEGAGGRPVQIGGQPHGDRLRIGPGRGIRHPGDAVALIDEIRQGHLIGGQRGLARIGLTQPLHHGQRLGHRDRRGRRIEALARDGNRLGRALGVETCRRRRIGPGPAIGVDGCQGDGGGGLISPESVFFLLIRPVPPFSLEI